MYNFNTMNSLTDLKGPKEKCYLHYLYDPDYACVFDLNLSGVICL